MGVDKEKNLYALPLGNIKISINRLFANCKGGNFNIHILAWFGYSSAKEGKSGFIYNLVKR